MRRSARLAAAVLAVTAGMFVLTGALNAAYQAERRSRAERHYRRGNQLAAGKHYAEAAEHFRTALSLARGKTVYELALAEALVGSGRTAEAGGYLLNLLAGDPVNARANLLLGRIMAGENDRAAAGAYFQRAIYGIWADRPVELRLATRFELVGLLLRWNGNSQAQAELIRASEEAPADYATRMRLGRLFLAAGAPQHAVREFEQALRSKPRDGAAHAGEGAALFALGDYRQARDALSNARRFGARDEETLRMHALAAEVLALDPGEPRLSSRDRLARSRRLAERALEALDRCLAAPDSPHMASDVRPRTDQLLKSRPTDAAALIAAAQETAAARKLVCPGPEPDAALELVLRRLTR